MLTFPFKEHTGIGGKIPLFKQVTTSYACTKLVGITHTQTHTHTHTHTPIYHTNDPGVLKHHDTGSLKVHT